MEVLRTEVEIVRRNSSWGTRRTFLGNHPPIIHCDIQCPFPFPFPRQPLSSAFSLQTTTRFPCVSESYTMASSFEAEEVLDPLSATAPKSELTPASLPATVSSESSTEADQVHQGYNHPVLQRKEEDYAREGDVEDNVQEEGHDSEAKNGDQQSREEHSVQIHEIVVVEALKALLDNGITVMEYGSQLMFRFGREECLVVRDHFRMHISERKF